MLKVLSNEMTRESEKDIISLGTTEEELINKAGRAVFSCYNFKGRTLIIIGKGNNGGDGLALAKLLKQNGKDVTILQIFNIEKPLILNMLTDCILSSIPVYKYDNSFKLYGYDTIVDAIFGVGFRDKLESPVKELIEEINKLTTYKISIDINSGLNSDNGKTELAFISDLTVSIGYIKPGCLLNDSKDYIKELKVVNIGIPYNKETYQMFLENDLENVFIERKNNSNKSTYGYVGVMGGSYKYSGAIKLSNLSLVSLSMGCGITRVIAPDSISDSILPFLLESTMYPLPSNEYGEFKYDINRIKDSIKGLKALAFGMGIGISNDNELILEYLLNNFENNLLIDADGLNILSRMNLEILNNSKSNIVLTPHVLEFSRLINVDKEEILNNPIKYAKEFTLKYNVVLVLKGTTTIISKNGKIYFVSTGCVTLSKGGSGDMLSGVIAGIMGYSSSLDASLAGSYVFGLAGDIARIKYGSYSVLSRDIINILKEIMKKY